MSTHRRMLPIALAMVAAQSFGAGYFDLHDKMLQQSPILNDQAEIKAQQQRIEHLTGEINKLQEQYVKLNSDNLVFMKKTDYTSVFHTPRKTKPVNDERDAIGSTNFSHFSGETGRFTINRFTVAENCVLGTAIEVFDEKKNILKVEEGPINLRKVTKLREGEYVPGQSLGYTLIFDTNNKDLVLPKVYFDNRQDQSKGYAIIETMRLLCKQRYDAHIQLYGDQVLEPQPLMVTESHGIGARPVRRLEDNPEQKAAF